MTEQTSSEVETFHVVSCSRPGYTRPPANGRGYCREHRNEYQREWKRTQAADLRDLRAQLARNG